MKSSSIVFFLFFVSTLLFSCNRKTKIVAAPSSSYDVDEGTSVDEGERLKKQPTPKAAQPYVLASIQKNGCFGNCPEYEFVIMSTGIATFHGKKYTPKVGSFKADMSAGKRLDLEEKIKAFNILSLKKMYPSNGNFIKDLPDTYILVNLHGKRIIIRNNHDAPKALLDFEKYLESVIERLEWYKVSDK